MDINNLKVLVRGAGDIASGIIWNLAYAGFKVLCIDVENPSCIRTEVSFSSAIDEGKKTLNNVTCIYIKNENDLKSIWDDGNVALMIDKNADILKKMKFDIVVDAILAKKNLGTTIDMADVVIGIGPGFTAKIDCHFAIETMRGHKLSTIYEEGEPMPDTGIPGLIASHGSDRVMHSPCDGVFRNVHKIGDVVKRGDTLSKIEVYENGKATGEIIDLEASIDGVLRGILRDGYKANKGLKAADIDPRLDEYNNCFTISDKARSIGGAVVTTILHAINCK